MLINANPRFCESVCQVQHQVLASLCCLDYVVSLKGDADGGGGGGVAAEAVQGPGGGSKRAS